jgi:hypothetical protein
MSSDEVASGITRRDFLKLLGAIGVAVTLPVPVDLASEEQVAAACERLAEEGFFFEVSAEEPHTIFIPGATLPEKRSEVYDIDLDPDRIVEEIECNPSLENMVECEFGEEWREASPRDLVRAAEEWLAGDVDGWDYEDLMLTDGPQGGARQFFLNFSFDDLEELGVVIVDGECPGSSYYAAELQKEIEEANRAAARLGLPFRFREETA